MYLVNLLVWVNDKMTGCNDKMFSCTATVKFILGYSRNKNLLFNFIQYKNSFLKSNPITIFTFQSGLFCKSLEKCSKNRLVDI